MPEILTRRLAMPFRWLMLAGIAWTLISGTLYLLAGPESATPTPAATVPGEPARAEVDIEALLARNLFGVAGARPNRPVDDTVNAVATQLPLELRGVFVADDAEGSAAIIAQRGQPGQLYTVNSTIAGSATLERVLPDHVILRRAGIAETLRFPDSSRNLVPASNQMRRDQGGNRRDPMDDYESMIEGSADDADYDESYDEGAYDDEGYEELYDESPTPSKYDLQAPVEVDEPEMDDTGDDSLSFYRERLDTDPEGTLRALGMTPVDLGDASGYRVDNLAQAPYLSQTGLQPGDVILSVNGRSVGDLRQDRLEFDNVLAEGAARIEVQRGTRRFFVTASIP